MSELDLKKLISEESYYQAIRILRSGPLKEETIIKYLTTASKLNPKNAVKVIKNLEKEKFLTSFTINKDGLYYLLVKDFYIIRIPPKDTLDYIQKKSEIPTSIRDRFLMSVKRFFSSYVSSTKKLKADFERNLIAILVNPELTNLIDSLRKKPMDLKSFEKRKSLFGEIKNILQKYEIIEIYSEGDKLGRSWVFLKTDLQFNFFFPEYLIKNITENLTNKKINKILALKSLYSLKKSYLIYEKPDMFEELNKKITAKLDLINSLEKKGEKPINKANDLKKLYKAIGDFDNRVLWQKKIKEWQKID